MKRFLLPLLFVFFILGCSNDDSQNPGNNDQMNQDPNDNDPVTQTGVVPCDNGMAGEYPCNGYDLLGNITLANFGAAAGNDCWDGPILILVESMH